MASTDAAKTVTVPISPDAGTSIFRYRFMQYTSNGARIFGALTTGARANYITTETIVTGQTHVAAWIPNGATVLGEVGAPIASAGVQITTLANGRVATASAGHAILGVSLAAGAAGETIPIQFMYLGVMA